MFCRNDALFSKSNPLPSRYPLPTPEILRIRETAPDWADNETKAPNATSSYSINPTMQKLHEILVLAGYLVGEYGDNLAWKKGDEAIYFEVYGSGNGQINRQIRVLTLFNGGTKVWSSRNNKVEGNRILILDDNQQWVRVL